MNDEGNKAGVVTAMPVHGGHAGIGLDYHQAGFSVEISEKLKCYVYRLVDPRNSETFYVGKGKGNRVFTHATGKKVEDQGGILSLKEERIRQIIASGFKVDCIIHRHGMDDATAFQVEAALIDAYSGLTNEVSGHGANDFGVMHVDGIIRRYQAQEAVFSEEVILININRTLAERSLLDATRYAWKVDVKKAKEAKYILAVDQGIIVAAFIADEWLPANTENFPKFEPAPGRYGFKGHEAPPEVRGRYVDKRVPSNMRKKGAANPIKYVSAS